MKMKFLLIFLGCFALSNATLLTDLMELVNTLPLQDLYELTQSFSQGDSEFINLIKYLQGNSEEGDFQGLIGRIKDDPYVISFNEWLKERGVDMDFVMDLINSAVGNIQTGSGGDMGGIQGFIDECFEIVDFEEIRSKLIDLLSDSMDFAEFFLKVASAESKKFLEGVLFVDPEFERLIQNLVESDVDVEMIKNLLYGFLGWDY